MLGLVLGDELSIQLFHSNPGYLGSAFAVGTQRVVGWKSIAIAAGGGMFAAVVAVLSPLRDIVSRDPLAAITPKQGSAAGRANIRTALAGVVCLAAATAVLLGAPKQAIVGMVLLIAALLLVLPVALELALALLTRLARAMTGPCRTGRDGAERARPGRSASPRPGRSPCSAQSRFRARTRIC